ncbi:MAG: cyclase family protein [Candidatus Schekmanbacteria bacterium]|nr:MAG: cyclase family protein [Candidatus Schekmanbacteria bacterium]
MKIYDISLPIREKMIGWPTDPKVKMRFKNKIDKGDVCNLTKVIMSAHSGTHIDAPYHFINDGKTVEKLELDCFYGDAAVYELDCEKQINVKDLKRFKISGEKRVLFKTRNSKLWRKKHFDKRYVFFTGKSAQYLVDCGVKLVGIDYLSVEQFGNEKHPAHDVFLSNEIVLLEGLNLTGISPGKYILSAFPLNFEGREGAPVRAVLIEK